jgi:O-methyltransferase
MQIDTARIWERVSRITAMDQERIESIVEQTQIITENDTPGAIVECGVWLGGGMAAVALALLEMGVTNRDLYLFDTFEGMTKPQDVDVDLHGNSAIPVFENLKTAPDRSNWCAAPLSAVIENMLATGYPSIRLEFVPGDVLNTIPSCAPEKIALLHLDTDWYQSTKHELEHLYPRVSSGGVVIEDDYGHWSGARLAVDEYLSTHYPGKLLVRCGYTSCIIIKGPNE